MRIVFIVLFVQFSFSILWAQQKTLSLKDIFSNRQLYPKQIYGIQPHFNKDYFTYVNDKGDLQKWDNKGKETTLLALNDFNSSIALLGEKSVQAIPDFQWINESEFYFIIGKKLYSFNLISKKSTILNFCPESADLIEWHNGTQRAAYTQQDNIFIAYNGGQEIPVNIESDKGVVSGKAVHRNEFGIEKGLFWSPQGNALAFYRMDESMVTDYPLVDINTRVAECKPVKYPMAGMTSHQVKVGVFHVKEGKKIFLNTGEPLEQYLTNICWSPDEKYIYVAVLNRAQNHMKLNQYDAYTGDFVKTLFEEKNDRYVEPMNTMKFIPDGSGRFLWLSQRDGFMHLYLYNNDGILISQLTKGAWMISDFGGFDSKGKNVWFYATKDSPLERHAYRLNLESREMTKLDAGKGTHTIVPTSSLNYIVDNYSNTTLASRYQLLNPPTKFQKTLLEDINPLKDYLFPKPEIIQLMGVSGVELYARLYKPVDFDSTKKYPVLIYVYGGPHTQLVTESWTAGSGYFLPYLASKGYVVFTLDNRGSSGRGLEFESVIHRNLGEAEAQDQMTGIDWLMKKTWVDNKRIGVHGWSYGGFMTINLLTKYPDVFKMGIAGGPVIDWKYYEIMYGERYMDTPDENPDGYKNSNLAARANQLKSRLLIIQGYQDATVVPQHYLTFIEASIKANKVVDQFVYPNHEHNVRGKDRMQLYQVIEQYIIDHL